MGGIGGMSARRAGPMDGMDWMAGGTCDRAAARAYGFNESQMVGAAVYAYMDAFDACKGDRSTLRAAFVAAFNEALNRLH